VAGQPLFNDSRVPGGFNLYSICITFYSRVQLFIESESFDTVWPFIESNRSAQCGAPTCFLCTFYDPSSTQTYVFETTSACHFDTHTDFLTDRPLFDEKVNGGNVILDAHPQNDYEHRPEDIPHHLVTPGMSKPLENNASEETDALVFSDNKSNLSTNIQPPSCSVYTHHNPLSTQSHTFKSTSMCIYDVHTDFYTNHPIFDKKVDSSIFEHNAGLCYAYGCQPETTPHHLVPSGMSKPSEIKFSTETNVGHDMGLQTHTGTGYR